MLPRRAIRQKSVAGRYLHAVARVEALEDVSTLGLTLVCLIPVGTWCQVGCVGPQAVIPRGDAEGLHRIRARALPAGADGGRRHGPHPGLLRHAPHRHLPQGAALVSAAYAFSTV